MTADMHMSQMEETAMTSKNQPHRNTRHKYRTGLRPESRTRQVRVQNEYIRCSQAILVVQNNRLVAYCSR